MKIMGMAYVEIMFPLFIIIMQGIIFQKLHDCCWENIILPGKETTIEFYLKTVHPFNSELQLSKESQLPLAGKKLSKCVPTFNS